MRATTRVVAVLFTFSCAASEASAQAVGSEFGVNSYTTGYQGNFYGGKHSVATDASGNFVVVWTSVGSSGSDSYGNSIQARRFDASGSPIGNDFQVNTYTTSNQVAPSVAADAAGGFVVAWHGYGSSGSDTSTDSIHARRFDSSGNAVGDEFQVNTFTTLHQRNPSIATSAAGGFVVAWHSEASAGTDSSGYSIHARRLDAAGSPIGDAFQVNTVTTSNQFSPSVATDATGGFVVVWHSLTSAGTDSDGLSIQARRFDSSGNPVGNDFQVNTFTGSAQRNPSVAAGGTGGFVISWVSNGSSGTDTLDDSIQARRFDSSGSAIGNDLQVNTYTPTFQRWPSVAADAAGGFVVSWISFGSSGNDGPSSYSIQARRFQPTGSPAGSDFQVNTFTTSDQTSPSVAAGPGGSFVVAWMGYAQDGSSWGVFGQRFAFGGPTTICQDPVFRSGFGSGVHPIVTISSPGDGGTHPAGAPVQFVGSANDPDDGPLSGSALVWCSDLDGAIGTGAFFSAMLSAGQHLVTLIATDSDGNTGADQVALTMTP